jgi:hypothetical protein
VDRVVRFLILVVVEAVLVNELLKLMNSGLAKSIFEAGLLVASIIGIPYIFIRMLKG